SAASCRVLGAPAAESPLPHPTGLRWFESLQLRSCKLSENIASGQQTANGTNGRSPQLLRLNTLQCLCSKRIDQHAACMFCVHAARAQIEETIGVELPYRGPVCALDIIGIDFEFRLCVGTRQTRQQQTVGTLDGIG